MRWRDRRRGKKERGCRGKKKRKGCKKGKEKQRWRKCDRMEGWIKIDVKSGREKEWEVGEKTPYPFHQRFWKHIYTIIAVGPLFVCLCVCGRTPPRPMVGSTSFLAQMSSTHPGLYRFFCMTISQRSRSPEVIEVFFFFVAM